jgi:hypothetical protein
VTEPSSAGPLQWPFVGLTVLLVLLILATPGLIGTGGPLAASGAAAACLDLDHYPGGNVTRFLVEACIGDVRYSELTLRLAAHPGWPVVASTHNLSWGYPLNVSESDWAAESTLANPVALNVSAVYVDSAGTTVTYVGAYAFNSTAGSISIQPLMSGLSSASTLALTVLPITLSLVLGPGGSS